MATFHGVSGLGVSGLVEAWAELHQAELLVNWERLQSGELTEKVDPLS